MSVSRKSGGLHKFGQIAGANCPFSSTLLVLKPSPLFLAAGLFEMKVVGAVRQVVSLAVGSFITVNAAMAQTRGADVNAYIAKTPIAGLPAGSFSQWTEEQKKTAITRIGGFCEFLCVDPPRTLPNVAAVELTKAEAKVCLAACIVNHLPPDYPQLMGMKQDLRINYDRAKKLGSAMGWPLPGK